MRDKTILTALLFLFLLCLFFPGGLSRGAALSLTPLLDTPSNRIYLRKLRNDLGKAEESIKVIMNTINYYPEYPEGPQRKLFNCLKKAVNRGVEVKILMDTSGWSKNITEENKKTAEFLKKSGMRIRFDSPSTTTHSKLVIIDGRIVYLGSSNWTYSTYAMTYQSDIRLQSKKIGQTCDDFFQYLWEGEKMSAKVPASSPLSSRTVMPIFNTKNSRCYLGVTRQAIEKAESTIRIAMYRIGYYPRFKNSPSNRLLDKLISAQNRGVKVKVLLDRSDWSDKTNRLNKKAAWWLKLNGIEVKFDSPKTDTHLQSRVVCFKKTRPDVHHPVPN